MTKYPLAFPADNCHFALMNETETLPERFRRWFAENGWQPRPHQLELLARAGAAKLRLSTRSAAMARRVCIDLCRLSR